MMRALRRRTTTLCGRWLLPVLLLLLLLAVSVAGQPQPPSPAADGGQTCEDADHSCTEPGDEPGAVLRLHNGLAMPAVGLGCAAALAPQAVVAALDLGVRLLDTAQATEWYSEVNIGTALREVSERIPRSDIFITSKLHPRDHGYESTLRAFPRSLERMGTDYVDLFLLHFPHCWPGICGDHQPEGTWEDSYRALEELYRKGQVKAIGVSNFALHQLQHLVETVATITPHAVQNWMDPLHQDAEVRAFCKKHGIVYTAYSTLGTQWRDTPSNPVLENEVLQAVATSHGRSVAQVVLRWALQSGAAVIPRASSAAHLAENQQLGGFALTAADMAQIAALDGTRQR